MERASWDAVREFEPKTLRATLAEIEGQHHSIAPDSAVAEDRIERLRRRLQACPPDGLDALAGTLERIDLLAIADLLQGERDEVTAERAVHVGSRSGLSELAQRAWLLSVRNGASGRLTELLSRMGEEPATPRFAPEEDAERVRRWVTQGDLTLGLLRDLEALSTNIERWLAELPALSTEIVSESALCTELRRRMLTAGSASTLAGLGPVLLEWVEELTAEGAALLPEDFSIQYVTTLRPGRSWAEDVVDWILERFGSPAAIGQVGLWRRLEERAPGVVRELNSWLALRRLAEFFENINDPKGRFEFWRENFAESLEHVELAAGGQAVLLHLPPLAVVEFAVPPNAAYVYPDSHLPWLQRRRSPFVEAYKDKAKLVRIAGHPKGYRIIHTGGWQDRAAPLIHRLLARSAR